jgi:hypothetical protein
MSLVSPSPAYQAISPDGGATQTPDGVGDDVGLGVGDGVAVGDGVGVGVGVGVQAKIDPAAAVSLILETKTLTKKLVPSAVLSKAPVVVGKQVELVVPAT